MDSGKKEKRKKWRYVQGMIMKSSPALVLRIQSVLEPRGVVRSHCHRDEGPKELCVATSVREKDTIIEIVGRTEKAKGNMMGMTMMMNGLMVMKVMNWKMMPRLVLPLSMCLSCSGGIISFN